MGIHFRSVNFYYSPLSRKILNNISFDVNKQDEFIFVVGHTGSGKSTLVQNMNALLLPNSGQIEVYGKKVILYEKKVIVRNNKKNRVLFRTEDSKKLFVKGVKPVYSTHLKELRKHIGLVFQFPEYQLFEYTVLKDVMFGPKNFGKSEEQAKRDSIEACKLVGLSDELLERSPFNLSGGQMRRVAIAGIIAIGPDVIVLDEPTVGLDPKGKEELMHLLVDIQAKTHKTIIIISHDMNVVASYAKRVIVLNRGNLVFDGKPRDLFEDSELLKEHNLELSTSAALACKLKEKGFINYTHLPLTVDELEKVILGGDING